MTRQDERKAAITAYKERKQDAGIYAVHCQASGQYWVGYAPDLDKIGNRIWFALKLGRHNIASLQAAWHGHGQAAFSLKVLEIFAEDLADFVRAKLSRDRLRHWVEALGAMAA